ncbi:hypothetical protein FS837_009229 [Tulasnella sp. UAMH 9824]|nr:hypothetical protein FS837_009229 [Tulasnella sp. UAMH 9824]
MAGANYMGGKGRTAKDRLKNKNAVKTKEHFAKSHLSARNLNPFLARGGTNTGVTRPTFDFQHARLACAKAPSGAGLRSTPNNGNPEPSPSEISGVNSTPKSKKRKTPPSKAMRQLEDAERKSAGWGHRGIDLFHITAISYAYKRMKVLELPDFAGLGKFRAAASPKAGSSEDVKQTSPAAPFPMTLSQENEVYDCSQSMEEDKADTFLKGSSRFHPDDSPSSLPLVVRRPFSYETPRRPSAKQVPKPANQPTPLSYSSSSSPWPASADNRRVAASDRSASFDPLSLDTSVNASTPKDDENHMKEANSLTPLSIEDPWTCLATQMNIKLSPLRQDAPFLPCDEYFGERLPPSERSGADFYAALWAGQYPPKTTGVRYDDATAEQVPSRGQNLYDYLSPDDPTGPSEDWSICVDHDNGLDEDYSSTEVNLDTETPQDRKMYGSRDWNELSDSTQMERDDIETLSLEELHEIDEDPEAGMEEVDQVGLSNGTYKPSLLEKAPSVEEDRRPDRSVLPSRLEIQPSIIPSSSILSFDPTPASVSSRAKSTQPRDEVTVPTQQCDQPESSGSVYASALPNSLPSPSRDDDPFDFLESLDHKLVSEDVDFNIEDILDGKLCDELPQKITLNPFEQLTTKDVAMPKSRSFEEDRTAPQKTRLAVRFMSPLHSSGEYDISGSIIREDPRVPPTPHRASMKLPSAYERRNPSLPAAEESKVDMPHETPSKRIPTFASGAALTSENGRLMGPSLFDDPEGSDDEY